MSVFGEMKFYKLLAEKWPTKKDVLSEIINLQAIVSLPKGTEHFVSDIHGEYEHFIHLMRTASGVIKAKIKDTYENELSPASQIRLANLIYYPERALRDIVKDKAWYKENLLRLIEVCKTACAKYTRSKVRKALPEKYAYIIDELLNCDSKNINKEHYYNEIIESIISLGCADDFIIEIAAVIRSLSIDHLHIVGDIFDRGARPDIVMDTITAYKSVDIQWGNHDIVWMGAMMGNEACIAVAVANSMKYENMAFLEEGYGISLRQLEGFAARHYTGKNAAEKMYKAISVIRFKLEDQIRKENPEFGMTDSTRLDKIDFETLTWCGHKLNTNEFPTIDRENPLALTEEEQELIEGLKHSFLCSEKMQKHLKFLFSKGSIYLCYNGNLLYHGCIPLDENGDFKEVKFGKNTSSGKGWMDFCEKKLRAAYSKRNRENTDFVWYLWCGADSPLFGKEKMATFERMYLDDKETHKEIKQHYFTFQNSEEVCFKILEEFQLDKSGHIINGHIPVKYKAGESPIKANGRLFMIDGGMAKSYRKQTGIAGYTLIFTSYGLTLTSHSPFEGVDVIIENNLEMMSQKNIVEKATQRILVGDTDIGKKLFDDIEDLKNLMFLYNSGVIPEK
ncbi:MAG: fructose-1,6-bisphosphatase [Clostridia bacterium]|nr:fructose-1,6-bisphosphatase [Clostridia bacterium]MBQ9737746.1 fructose-1,6-bisphosphatase [Clostridia bacterium]